MNQYTTEAMPLLNPEVHAVDSSCMKDGIGLVFVAVKKLRTRPPQAIRSLHWD
jgi:hypothetical protein